MEEPEWGSRRYQGKIFGKEDSDDITVGRQMRFSMQKQHVVLYVTTRMVREVTVLSSQSGRVIPIWRPLEPLDKESVVANRKSTSNNA